MTHSRDTPDGQHGVDVVHSIHSPEDDYETFHLDELIPRPFRAEPP